MGSTTATHTVAYPTRGLGKLMKLSLNTLLGSLATAIIVGLFSWVFTVNAQMQVLKANHDTHAARTAHKNDRQEQITSVTTAFHAHEGLAIHPEGQRTLTAIQTTQAAHTAELTAIQKSLDRIARSIANIPRQPATR